VNSACLLQFVGRLSGDELLHVVRHGMTTLKWTDFLFLVAVRSLLSHFDSEEESQSSHSCTFCSLLLLCMTDEQLCSQSGLALERFCSNFVLKYEVVVKS